MNAYISIHGTDDTNWYNLNIIYTYGTKLICAEGQTNTNLSCYLVWTNFLNTRIIISLDHLNFYYVSFSILVHTDILVLCQASICSWYLTHGCTSPRYIDIFIYQSNIIGMDWILKVCFRVAYVKVSIVVKNKWDWGLLMLSHSRRRPHGQQDWF